MKEFIKTEQIGKVTLRHINVNREDLFLLLTQYILGLFLLKQGNK